MWGLGVWNWSPKNANEPRDFLYISLALLWCVVYNTLMKNYSNDEIMRVLRQFPHYTIEDATTYLNERYDEYYDPEGMREHIDMLEEREMESHIEHIRSQGGDYWRNDAGEWCCG